MVSPAWAIKPSSVALKPTSGRRTATTGFYHLKRQGGSLSDSIYKLQETGNAAFSQPTAIYHGSDQAAVIGSQRNGQYFYRVRASNQGKPAEAWSESVTVIVRHYFLAWAFTFLAAGTAVFLATLALAVSGAWREEKPRWQ